VIDFKPSQVEMGHMPLVDTMGRCEREFAAAIIVRVCQAKGDTWQSVAFSDIKHVLTADAEAGTLPFAKLVRCPVFRPDAWDLVAKGFARWVGEPGDVIELTDIGLEAIRKHVSKAGAK
jgi:hypothetical protein